MTGKFRKAVRGVVLDGEITPEEKKMLETLAIQEKIPSNEAEIFITNKLKKQRRKVNRQEGREPINRNAIIGAIGTIGTVVVKTFIEKDNNKNK